LNPAVTGSLALFGAEEVPTREWAITNPEIHEMNAMSRFARTLLALIFAAFALPGVAATNTKYFWAEFDPTISTTMKVNVVLNNATPPPGVSTINSIRIQMVGAPPGITITGVSMIAQNGTAITPIVLAPSPNPGTDVVVANFPGIKNNKSATFQLTLAGTLPSSCSAINWAVYANTGNAYPQGDEFQQSLTVPSKLLTGIGCTGTLGCDPNNRIAGDLLTTAQVTYTKETDQGKWGLTRGNNKDALPLCQVVPYTFEVNYLSNPQTSKFIVPIR
jgi:hypothetical protein